MTEIYSITTAEHILCLSYRIRPINSKATHVQIFTIQSCQVSGVRSLDFLFMPGVFWAATSVSKPLKTTLTLAQRHMHQHKRAICTTNTAPLM